MINFEIIRYSVIFAAPLYCQYSSDHLIFEPRFYECFNSCIIPLLNMLFAELVTLSFSILSK